MGKHSVKNSLPERPNLRDLSEDHYNKFSLQKRTGGAVPRAENVGDLITADHKVLSGGCESRNNHRYAVVVHDLATQWIQSYLCKTKTSQETLRSLQKFLEPDRKPEVNRQKLGKISPGIIVRRHHTDRKQMLREQCAE